KQNNNSTLSNTETDSKNLSNPKSGHPLTGVWKCFERGAPKGDGHWEGTSNYFGAHLANSYKNISEKWKRHFNYILVNNLEDIPTDEPLYDMPNTTSFLVKQKKAKLTNWFDSVRIEPSKQSIIDEAIALAFIMCGFSFCVIDNPFFVNALKLLNPGYKVLSREILSGHLLDIEVAKVINKINKILDHTTNLTIEDIQENHSEILNPVILTILHSRGFFSDMQYLSEILLLIKDTILSVEANHSTLANYYINLMRIAAAIQNLPTDKYKGFRNYCIRKFDQRFEEFNDPAYQLIYFLHPAYKGIGLKFGTFPFIASYAGKLWQQMGKSQESCEALIIQLCFYKEQKQNINGNPNPYVAPYTIGSDMSLMWWNTYIDRLEGLAKVYRFNLSNPIDQLQERLVEEEDIELSNSTEDFYSNELDLNLNFSNFIDLRSSVFTNSEDRYENEVSNEIESDDDLQENEYDVDKIVSRQFNDSY
ncbi:15437_t:CDS:2, partial [Dentiscutata erythropus]